MKIELRDAKPGDLPVFYAMHNDPEAFRRVVFLPRKKDDFFKHWAKVLKNRLIVKKTVLYEGKTAGYVVSFFRTGTGKPKRREIGYWIARKYWGKGLASEGLRLLLEDHHTRPLFAHVAKTNLASRRVAEKCGFKIIGETVSQTEAGKDVYEFIFKLSGKPFR